MNTKIDLTFAPRVFVTFCVKILTSSWSAKFETGRRAETIQASLTGHLLSTVHTNDAPGMTRLVDMGVEPFWCLRPHRRHCAASCCVRSAEVQDGLRPTTERSAIGLEAHGRQGLLPRGRLPRMSQYGLPGRAGIYELLVVNDEGRQLILKNTDARTIKKAAVRNGMRTLLRTKGLKSAPWRYIDRRGPV